MKRLFDKIKSTFQNKKVAHANVSECYVCGSTEFEKIGKDKVCKGCGAVY